MPDSEARSRARAEFEGDKNAAYSELANLIEEYGYEPTVAACADLVSRRVGDSMREQYMEGDDGE